MTKPTIDIYVPDFIENAAEREFLTKLYSDLSARHLPALILANFFAGKGDHQIDFFVVTPLGAAHIELKNFIGPFSAKGRGPWLFKNPDGTTIQIEGRNSFLQARDGTLGISDEMRSLARVVKPVSQLSKLLA